MNSPELGQYPRSEFPPTYLFLVNHKSKQWQREASLNRIPVYGFEKTWKHQQTASEKGSLVTPTLLIPCAQPFIGGLMSECKRRKYLTLKDGGICKFSSVLAAKVQIKRDPTAHSDPSSTNIRAYPYGTAENSTNVRLRSHFYIASERTHSGT